MTAVRFLVNEVFDIPARGGLIALGSTQGGEFAGIPRLRDEASGQRIRVLGVDHPTARTRRTGETILVVDRADAACVVAGRRWVEEPHPLRLAFERTAERHTGDGRESDR